MEHYQLIKIAHSAVAVLVLLGLLAHVFMLWKAQRSGDADVLQRKLKRTRFISVPVLALLALTLPFSGYWMVDMTGLPLSQMWLFASSLLFSLLVILGLLLSGKQPVVCPAGDPGPVAFQAPARLAGGGGDAGTSRLEALVHGLCGADHYPADRDHGADGRQAGLRGCSQKGLQARAVTLFFCACRVSALLIQRSDITGQPRFSASACRRGSGSTAKAWLTCSSSGKSFIESL